MSVGNVRIGIVAPGRALDQSIADRVSAIAGNSAELVFHPQCFLHDGHFAGPDQARADAFVEFANDPNLDAIWFARGGYGACRLLDLAFGRLGEAARRKTQENEAVLTGIAHINLETPDPSAPELRTVRAGERYPVIAEGTSNLDQIADSLSRLAETANDSLAKANQLLSPDNQRIFTQLMISMRDLATGLSGRLGSLERAAKSVDDTALVFQESARQLTRSMQQVVNDVQPLPAQAGETLRDAQPALREFTRATRALAQEVTQAVVRLEKNSSGLLQRADDAVDLSVLELRATAAELRTSAELAARTLDQLHDPRAAVLGPGERQFGPGESKP